MRRITVPFTRARRRRRDAKILLTERASVLIAHGALANAYGWEFYSLTATAFIGHGTDSFRRTHANGSVFVGGCKSGPLTPATVLPMYGRNCPRHSDPVEVVAIAPPERAGDRSIGGRVRTRRSNLHRFYMKRQLCTIRRG